MIIFNQQQVQQIDRNRPETLSTDADVHGEANNGDSPARSRRLSGMGGNGEAFFIASRALPLILGSVESRTSTWLSFPALSRVKRTMTFCTPATPSGYFQTEKTRFSISLRYWL